MMFLLDKPIGDLSEMDRQRSGTMLFFRVKLIADVVMLIFHFHASSPPNYVLLALLLIDLIFLVPYYLLTQHYRQGELFAVYVSLGLTILIITADLQTTGTLFSSKIGYYIMMLPVAGLVLPRAQIIRATAILCITAYTLTVLAETFGILPNNSLLEFYPWYVPFLHILIVGGTEGIVALLVARFFESVEQHRRSLAQMLTQARREAVWSTVGKQVIGAHTLDEVLTLIIQAINREINVESGSVLLREYNSDQLYFAKILRGDAQHFSSLRIKIGQGIAGWVAQTGQSVIVDDTSKDTRWYSGIDRVTGFTTRSILCVPLIAEGETIGVLELVNKVDGSFTQNDLRLLEAIATQVAPTIQNKRLQEQMLSSHTAPVELFRRVENAKQEWEQTVDAIDEAIALVDPDCRILRANRVLARWAGVSSAQLVGRRCYDIFHNADTPPEDCPHLRLLQTHQPAEGEVESQRLGKTLWLKTYPLHDSTGEHVGSVNVWRDITTERRLQAQLIQSEKMAATGRLAASIAHEINNPLQAISGCIDLAQATSDLEKIRRYLTLASTELERLAGVVRRMLDFYRPARAERVPVNVRELMEDVLLLSGKRLQHARVRVSTRWADEIPYVNGVADQLKQVFLNLILNAIEAMPQGGTLDIRGQTIQDGGHWVVLSIADSGAGVAPQDLERIFEPFFTTKPDGTGLGLAVSHSIITQHGGRIIVDSAPGHGTTFTIWLPVQSQ
ncbi:MAG: ATP-binding protein [Anaerolineae bacterium]|nr:ATP-binding protein [Anaerolineae bacterium]